MGSAPSIVRHLLVVGNREQGAIEGAIGKDVIINPAILISQWLISTPSLVIANCWFRAVAVRQFGLDRYANVGQFDGEWEEGAEARGDGGGGGVRILVVPVQGQTEFPNSCQNL